MSDPGTLLGTLLLQELPHWLHAGGVKAAPLLWAGLGGVYSERSGVINIGLEGMMLTGAFAGVAGSGLTGNPWLGLVSGAAAGGILGLVYAWVVLQGKADQIVCGMGINLFALGITGFLLDRIFHARGNSPEVPKLPQFSGRIDFPFFSDLLFPCSPLHLLLIGTAAVTVYLFYQTAYGLRLRACGEDPRVVEAAGLHPARYRYPAIIISGMLAGLGGVQLAISDISQFSVGMSNGRGFVALAALICSGWRPGRLAGVCLFFGCAEALGERLQSVFPLIPPRAYLLLPFVLVLIVLAFRKQMVQSPRALGKL